MAGKQFAEKEKFLKGLMLRSVLSFSKQLFPFSENNEFYKINTVGKFFHPQLTEFPSL